MMKGKPEAIYVIDELGAEGDGIARSDGRSLYIPFALPGETITLKGKPRSIGKGNASGDLGRIVEASPSRIEPVCSHFGQCGGCRLQHLHADGIAAHKRVALVTALSRKGLFTDNIGETVSTPPHSRRRARFDYQNSRRGPVFGYKKRRSHDGIDLKMCPVLTPALEALVPKLRHLLQRLPAMSGGGTVQITETETGFDIILEPTKHTMLDLNQREQLAGWCDEHRIARLCWNDGDGPQPVAARNPAQSRFGNVTVDLPVNSFLQPSTDGQTALTELAASALKEHKKKAKRLADLFSGCGSFALPLAQSFGAIVDAYDIDGSMISTLRQAAGRHEETLRVTATARDLFNQPLTPAELKQYDAVIFDPPKAGAVAQAGELAMSDVPLVIAVSCNPSTLARDLRLLVDQGYALQQVTPVDQFTWSGQLEAVAVLTK